MRASTVKFFIIKIQSDSNLLTGVNLLHWQQRQLHPAALATI